MLAGEALPSWPVLAAYLLHTAAGVSVGRSELAPPDGVAPFHFHDATDYYLFYRPDIDVLRGDELILNAARAERVQAASGKNDRKAVVFAPGKYMSQDDLTDMGIVFCQLPWELYRTG